MFIEQTGTAGGSGFPHRKRGACMVPGISGWARQTARKDEGTIAPLEKLTMERGAYAISLAPQSVILRLGLSSGTEKSNLVK